jgi:hypothetical protein
VTERDDLTEDETLFLLIHAESGVGKSSLGHTAPAPRLILDSENGSRFYRGPKTRWNPMDPPPEDDGSWDSCIVQVRDWQTVEQAYAWLNSGKHPFRSVVVDSLTEIQRRCKDTIGREDFREKDWGTLLTRMEKVVREMRDLTMHPVQPLNCVVLLALSDEKKGKVRPFVQGSLTTSLPGFVDAIGYYAVSSDDQGEPVRRLLFQPIDPYVAKDRTDGLPTTLDVPKGESDTIVKMIKTIYREDIKNG